MASRSFIEQFNVEDPTAWNLWLERLNAFLLVNDIKDEEKKRAYLITTLGSQAYSILKNCITPQSPNDMAYEKLTEALTNYFTPKMNTIFARFQFNSRGQQPGENIQNYINQLKNLSSLCSFGSFLDDALRDRFVVGLINKRIQKDLLSRGTLNFDEACKIALSIESAESDCEKFLTQSNVVHSLKVKQKAESTTNDLQKHKFHCFRCLSEEHLAPKCPYANKKCNKCGKMGHLAKACRSSRKSNVQSVTETENTGKENLFELQIGSVSDSSKAWMIQLMVENTPINFEVDTGSARTIIDEKSWHSLRTHSKLEPAKVRLTSYTGDTIPVSGEAMLKLVHGENEINAKVIVATGKNRQNLLGRDVLSTLHLDWSKVCAIKTDFMDSELLKNYEEVFADTPGTIKDFTASIHVKEGAKPMFFKPRPVPLALRERVTEKLDQMEKDGVIRRVEYSDWASPLVLVPKSDGSLRVCADYKVSINKCIHVNEYPLPRHEELFSALNNGKLFSKLDLSGAYHQLELTEKSKEYTTVNTLKGLYQFNRIPYGIASAPAIFQETMEKMLNGIPRIAIFIDDVIISGTSVEEHDKILRMVLDRFQKFGVKVNKQKCEFSKDQVQYLGFIVSKEGIRASPSNVSAIMNAPKPTSISTLRSFLGMVNYYASFIPNLSTLAKPLNRKLAHDKPWSWDKVADAAFSELKRILASDLVLTHYCSEYPVILACDASQVGIGCVLSHVMPNGEEKPIAYASKSLNAAQQNYAQIEREALSIVYGVEKFHQYLFGRHFTLLTDHQALSIIFNQTRAIPQMAAARLQRWAIKLSAFSYDVKFRSTKLHGNCDGLSRLPVEKSEEMISDTTVYMTKLVEALPIDSAHVRRATQKDSILPQVIRWTNFGWPAKPPPEFQPYFSRSSEITCVQGVLLWGSRVIIPQSLQKRILEELHSDHVGVSKMKAMARCHFWFPGLDKQIENLARTCTNCALIQKMPASAKTHVWEWPNKPWSRIHIDLAGPFLQNDFLIVYDAGTKWGDVKILQNTSSHTIVQHLREIFSYFGLPETLVSDNGPQFTSAEFAQFMKINGIRHLRSAPFHPATNGAAERFVQSFKQGMKKNSSLPLRKRLCNFLLSYRTQVHATTNTSPAELMFGRKIRTKLDLLHPDVGKTVEANTERWPKATRAARNFQLGDVVWARMYNAGPRWRRGEVMEITGPLSYRISIDGELHRRHVDQLRRADDNGHPEDISPICVSLPICASSPVSDDLVPVSDLPEIPEIAAPPIPEAQSISGDSGVEPAARRYPTRDRKAPDRLLL